MAHFSHAAAVIAAECSCIRIRQAARLLTRVYDEALRESGLQASQLGVLVAVARFGESGAQIGALAKALVMDRTTLSRNLGPLEKAGLLRVARDPADARARIVLLTPEGERAIERAFKRWESAERRVKRGVGQRRLKELHRELGDLVANTSIADTSADPKA